MGCASAVSGCILIIVNLIFLILGLALAAGGGILTWGSDVVMKPIEQVLNGAASGQSDKAEIAKALQDIFGYLENYGIALFVVGIILVILSLMAICGVCCKSKWILGTYAFIIALFTLLVVAFTVVLYVKPHWVRDTTQAQLEKFIKSNYKGPENQQTMFKGISGVVDLVQIAYGCCGVANSSFYDSFKWNKEFTMEHSGRNITLNLTIPASCCKFEEKVIDQTCLFQPNATNSNMEQGCFAKMWDAVDENWDYVRYGHIGLSVFMLLMFILTVCAMRYEKEKVNPI